MLRCRNYVEQALFRPRIMQPSKLDDGKAVLDVGRYTRGSGARNHMFVRVGKSFAPENEDMEKRSGQTQLNRGLLVRIGRVAVTITLLSTMPRVTGQVDG